MQFNDASSTFSALFNQVTIRTTITPDINIDLSAPPDPATHALLAKLRPAIHLSGPAGTFDIAPYGDPTEVNDDLLNALVEIGAALALSGLGIGLTLYLAGRRSARIKA